jgi:hypothetical protein
MYWKKCNDENNAIVGDNNTPSTHIYLRQRGENRPIYMIDCIMGISGKLAGDNFISFICKGEYDKLNNTQSTSNNDIVYDADTDIWLCGEESNPDFLFYLLRYANGNRIDYFITRDEIPKLRLIYKKYNFTQLVEIIDYASSWCSLY